MQSGRVGAVVLSRLSLCLLVACSDIVPARADTFVLDWPTSTWSITGSDLVIFNYSISIYIDTLTTDETDVVARFSFDTRPWTWEMYFLEGGIGEGGGYCVLEADVPNAYLRCDGPAYYW